MFAARMRSKKYASTLLVPAWAVAWDCWELVGSGGRSGGIVRETILSTLRSDGSCSEWWRAADSLSILWLNWSIGMVWWCPRTLLGGDSGDELAEDTDDVSDTLRLRRTLLASSALLAMGVGEDDDDETPPRLRLRT